MRFAIFSDLHGNLEATEAVLRDAQEQECTQFICLGDLVGYNANPHECIELVRQLNCPVVKGNHDEQALLEHSTREFNQVAEQSLDWTRAHLTSEDKEWLAALPLSQQVGEFTIVHATLDQPESWGYVFNNLDATASFCVQQTQLCFFGHTHVPAAFVSDGDDRIKRLKTDQLEIEPDKKYFINVGSVGQPRDGDQRAAYCVYDDNLKHVEQRRVPYDLSATQTKILNADLPRPLAERLAVGR